MKRLDRLVFKSFIGPYVLSFFIAVFVLVMQFLWKYIDDFVGKGLSIWFLIELIFYYSVTIIPMAVPITILISSVMVYGNMAEKYEMTSFKSAGISLLRIMWPGIIIAFFTFGFSLVSSNFFKPKANFQFFKAFDNARKQKPSLTIEEAIFNDDFHNFSIRVGQKAEDDISIKDVMIYDNSNRSFLNLTKAESGKMYTSQNGKYFIMELENGEQYRELINSDPKQRNKSTAFLRTEFKTWKKTFDMSEFEFSERASGLTRRKYDLYNTIQLLNGLDSINNDLIKIRFKKKYSYGNPGFIDIDSTDFLRVEELEKQKLTKYEQKNASISNENSEIENDRSTEEKEHGSNLEKLGTTLKKLEKTGIQYPSKSNKNTSPNREHFIKSYHIDSVKSLANILPEYIKSSIMFRAINSAQTLNERIKASNNENRIKNTLKRKYILRLNQMYSWAFICIIFLFIGAPLGSIVRKGGYGYPLLIAIIFFMVFIVLMILGEKLNKSESMAPILAAWLPCIVLSPISILLSYLALHDINLLSITSFKSILRRIIEQRKNA